MIERVAQSIAMQCVGRTRPLIKNRIKESSGGPLLCRLLATPVPDNDGGFNGILMAYNDASREPFDAAAAEQLQQFAKEFAPVRSLANDPLTQLPTRAAFQEQVEERMRLADETPGVLLYCDIDQLHVINDLWGFEVGDQAIAAVARQLTAEVEKQDGVVSRLSGDRFTIFIARCPLARGRQIAENARQCIGNVDLSVANGKLELTMSIGVAALDPANARLDHVLAAAEVACKAAKDRGRNRVEVYQDADVSIIRRHDDILRVGMVRSALDEGRIRVLAQPIASLQKADVVNRYEMLIRILDPKDRLVSPHEFMSAATRYQLLPKIDRCVVSAVLTQLSERRKLPGFRPIQVSINLSGPTISDPEFLEWLLTQIDRSGLPGSWLGFELTESAAVQNVEHAQHLISKLTALGCSFMLDDFGVGMSSLAYLQTFDISMVKIDGSFVRDLLVNPRSEALVRAIAQLTTSMGIATTAEYVESAEICMRLIELGVQYGQGYAIGRPQPLERVLAGAPPLAQAS
jgi:diguanylate cyclase (GGDEF)-like protein